MGLKLRTYVYAHLHLRSVDREIATAVSFLATHECEQVEHLLASLIQRRIEFLNFIRRFSLRVCPAAPSSTSGAPAGGSRPSLPAPNGSGSRASSCCRG